MTEFTILWRAADSQRDSAPASGTSRINTEPLPSGVRVYRGVRDPAAILWLVEGADSAQAQQLAERHGIPSQHIRKLTLLQEWGGVFQKALPYANFVLREMQPDSVERFIPQLHGQIAQVISRPGCFGQILAAEKDAPSHLLGVTYWEAERSFTQYMEWASKHPWKNTVDPVTSGVPLRLFTRRAGTAAASGITTSDKG